MQTLNQIAQTFGVTTQTVRNWKADAEADLGYEITGQAHPTDKRKVVYGAEAVALITAGRASAPGEKEPARTPDILPPGVADPFSGLARRESSAMTAPGHFQATDRTLAVLDIEDQVQQICDAAAVNQQQSIQEMVANGNQTGAALGAFLAQSIIQSAEEQKAALLAQYMQSQGVSTAPKQQPPQGEPAAS